MGNFLSGFVYRDSATVVSCVRRITINQNSFVFAKERTICKVKKFEGQKHIFAGFGTYLQYL